MQCLELVSGSRLKTQETVVMGDNQKMYICKTEQNIMKRRLINMTGDIVIEVKKQNM